METQIIEHQNLIKTRYQKPTETFQIKAVKAGILCHYELIDPSKKDFITKMTASQMNQVRKLMKQFTWNLQPGEIANVLIEDWKYFISFQIEKDKRSLAEQIFSDGIEHHIIGKRGKITTTKYR